MLSHCLNVNVYLTFKKNTRLVEDFFFHSLKKYIVNFTSTFQREMCDFLLERFQNALIKNSLVVELIILMSI